MPPITTERLLTEDLFTLLGMEHLPDSEKADILAKVDQTINLRVYRAITEELEASDLEKLDRMDAAEIVPFLESLGYNVRQMIAQEALAYRIELSSLYTLATQPSAA